MDYVTESIYANIYITHNRDKTHIYQKIRIVPQKPIFLKYFMYEKYKIGRIVHDLFQELYLGDGDNIMYESTMTFKNTKTITYRIDNEIDLDLDDQEYHVEGERPKFDACSACTYLVISKSGADKCRFHKKFLKRHKKSCTDFLEKGNDNGAV